MSLLPLSGSSSAGALIARAAIAQPLTQRNSSIPPVFVVLICASVMAISLGSICAWRRLSIGGAVPSTVSIYIPTGRRAREAVRRPPEMFNAWTGRCTSNSLKWAEYMPFSVTVLTKPNAKIITGPVRKTGKLWGDSEKRDKGSRRLQVGFLVAMPSQLHTKTHDRVIAQELSGSPLRDELAIGLIETWVEGRSIASDI